MKKSRSTWERMVRILREADDAPVAEAANKHDAGDQPEAMLSSQVRRRQVGYAQECGESSRRACALLSMARSTLGYEFRLEPKPRGLLPRRVRLQRSEAPLIDAIDPRVEGRMGLVQLGQSRRLAA